MDASPHLPYTCLLFLPRARSARTRGARGWMRTVLGAGALLASPAFIVAIHVGFTGH